MSCKEPKTQVSLPKSSGMELNIKEMYYLDKLSDRDEYALECRKNANEVIRVHYEPRMISTARTYCIEKLNIGSPEGRTLLKAYTKITNAAGGYRTEATVYDSLRDTTLINQWKLLAKSVQKLKNLEDHRQQRWLGSSHFYVFEVEIQDLFFDLYHQPNIGEDSVAIEVYELIKNICPNLKENDVN